MIDENMNPEEEQKAGADEAVAVIDEAGPLAGDQLEDRPSEEVEPSLEEQLAAAQAKAAENLEGWQRAVAELSNARKRFNQQMQEAHRNTAADVVGKLLPILDDFDRALVSVPESVAEDGWYDGIKLVRRKLDGILESLNVEPIEAVGKPFDPNLHEALSSEESEEHESGIVTRELLPGYKIGSRVIRPSLVYVAA